jgi:hypothetical protein
MERWTRPTSIPRPAASTRRSPTLNQVADAATEQCDALSDELDDAIAKVNEEAESIETDG